MGSHEILSLECFSNLSDSKLENYVMEKYKSVHGDIPFNWDKFVRITSATGQQEIDNGESDTEEPKAKKQKQTKKLDNE